MLQTRERLITIYTPKINIKIVLVSQKQLHFTMRIIRKWQIGLHNYILQKKLSAHKVTRYPKGFDEAQSIGILFDATDPQERQIVKHYASFIEKKGKNVQLFAFLNDEQVQNNFTFKHFSKKELDWTLKPKDQIIANFINTPFDFLINVYQGKNIPLEYISSLSKAHIRVGPYTDKDNCFDLMIETNEQTDLCYFVKQLEYFLSRMNSQKHEEAIV